MRSLIKVLIYLTTSITANYSYSQINMTAQQKPQPKDSTIHAIGDLIDGKKNGAWVYYRSGNILRTSYFKQDTLIKATVYFNPDGGVSRIIPFKGGLISGKVKFYSKDGDLIAIYLYENGGFMGTEFRKATRESPQNGHGYDPLDDYNP